ncbi:hypothetical protein HYPSUDRAFT_58752 [Hypholoma sublateritium FD-334 SS-4]|uniref:Uncharacterized protein n=1 Tax=Hypholoma sublateritium (strain FD-334 SS-4) TaxID=945553 RepID=A0A0D2N8S2_HYPSF|nr:hypothetical protein HYPSUDRAFT_58752 [Hypholoma sublateritium FD-334 SS-4]
MSSQSAISPESAFTWIIPNNGFPTAGGFGPWPSDVFNDLGTSSTSVSTSQEPSFAQATASQQPVETIQVISPSIARGATHRGIGGALAGGLAGGVIAVITVCAIIILARRRNARRAAVHSGETVPTPFAEYSWSERGRNIDSMGALPARAGISLPKAARHRDRRGRAVGTAAPPFRHAAGEKRGVLASTPALLSPPMRSPSLEEQMAHEIFTLRASIREMEYSQRSASAARRVVSTVEWDAPPDYVDAIPF